VVLSQTNHGLPAFSWALDKGLGCSNEFVVTCLHALAVEGAGVHDLLLADFAPARLHGRVVPVGGPGMDHAARAVVAVIVREILRREVVILLRLFLGVQVIQVAQELVEPMVGRQHVVQVAQVVLAELPRRVALIFQRRRYGQDLLAHSDGGARHADLGKARPQHALSSDER
jgi:hypothetical protein